MGVSNFNSSISSYLSQNTGLGAKQLDRDCEEKCHLEETLEEIMRNFRTEEAVGREEEEEGWEEVGGGAWEEGVGGDSWEYTGIRREGGGRREERGGGRNASEEEGRGREEEGEREEGGGRRSEGGMGGSSISRRMESKVHMLYKWEVMMLLSSSRKNCLISFLSSKSRFFRNFSDKAVSSLKIVVRSQINTGIGFSISISTGGME